MYTMNKSLQGLTPVEPKVQQSPDETTTFYTSRQKLKYQWECWFAIKGFLFCFSQQILSEQVQEL